MNAANVLIFELISSNKLAYTEKILQYLPLINSIVMEYSGVENIATTCASSSFAPMQSSKINLLVLY